MTKKELIALLDSFQDDQEVIVDTASGYSFIEEVLETDWDNSKAIVLSVFQ